MPYRTCRRCGSIYYVKAYYIGMTDEDSVSCDICQEEIVSWSGPVFYEVYLVQPGDTPQQQAQAGPDSPMGSSSP